MKQPAVFEVFQDGTFIAVVKPGSGTSDQLWKNLRMAYRGDIHAPKLPPTRGFMPRLGLIEAARGVAK